MFRFSKRSIKNLDGVHWALKMVASRALEISTVDFVVIEGVRNQRRQKRLVETGASSTMDSRHLTGHAIDVAAWVGGEISWAWPHYFLIAKAFKQAAKELEIDIVWGGDWKSFIDGPHYELCRKSYPKAANDSGPTKIDVKTKSQTTRKPAKRKTKKKTATTEV